MKFLVDSLPYYGEFCPFIEKCYKMSLIRGPIDCPRYWSPDKVCSDKNLGECELLAEVAHP